MRDLIDKIVADNRPTIQDELNIVIEELETSLDVIKLQTACSIRTLEQQVSILDISSIIKYAQWQINLIKFNSNEVQEL